MAPDLNGVSSGERWDYSTPGSSGYKVPNIAWHDPATRKIKVVCIGGGVSGILNAYNIQKYCQNVDLKVFEKNSEIGGTWLENRYPGCACDIPSHAYTYNFALNPDWPRFMSYSDDIWKYLEKVCNVFGLKRYIQFNSRVAGCWWQEDEGEWLVRVEKLDGAGQVADTIEERAHVLLYASGILNNWKWPDIEGLHDFRGRLVHTAHWPPDYQEGQWKNDTVGVIGSGASSIQTVPNMQPFVKHMDVFVRTAVWFTQIAENYGQNHEYSDEEKTKFREDPNALVEHAKYFEDRVNGVWGGFLNGTKASDDLKKLFRERMKEHIKDERLLQGFTPQFGVGCRRITPGDPYMKAIQEPNVDVHFTHATRVTADGIVGADGIERKCDTVVCATGFDVSYRPRFPLVGRGGIDLRDQWKDDPQGYLGLAVPRYPNLVWFVGPAWPAENGSAIGPLQGVGEYAIQMIRKLQFENIHSLDPKQDATDDYNKHTQEWIKHTVWKEDCRSWYKNNETGKVNAIYPGSSMHYLMAIRHPRWEDYEIKYRSVDGFAGMDGKPAFGTNRFSWLGAGHTMHTQEEGRAVGLDPSPYLQAQFLEPEWLVACGYSKEQAREIVLDAAAAAARKEKARLLDLEGRGEGGSVLRDNGAKSL